MALGLRNYWLAICLVPCLIMIIDTLSEKFFSIVTPTSRDKLRRIIDNETKEDEAIFRASRISSVTSSSTNPMMKTTESESIFPRMKTNDFSPLTAGQEKRDSDGSYQI